MSSEKPVDGSWSALAAAAGRLMMDVMQSEWEPLSHCELEQRLDQAVEELLEAELISDMDDQSRRAFTQLSQENEKIILTDNSHMCRPTLFVQQEEEEPALEKDQHITEIEENPTVQYLTSLLQKLKWNEGQRRLRGRACMSLSHTVFLSVTLLSTRLSYRIMSSSFNLEKGNIHRIFTSFCHRVNMLQSQIIRWPTALEASTVLLPFSTWNGLDKKLEQNGLPKVLGVLGHTHILIRRSPSKQDSEGNTLHAKCLKKGSDTNLWVNLELVCDAEGRFIHCSVSPGSCWNRGEALRQMLAQNPGLLPPGTCLLAGVGYPLTQHILTPFRHTQNPQENLYNRVLETHLRRLEQATADLKERFGRLCCLDVGSSKKAEAVVLTCCILHTALLNAGHTTTGQVEHHTEEEEEEEEVREEAGVRMRETVANLLYRTLGREEYKGHEGHG